MSSKNSWFLEGEQREEEEEESDLSEEEDLDESEEGQSTNEETTSSQCNKNPFHSNSSGVSSMDASEQLRGVCSNGTLEDFFLSDASEHEEPKKPVDVDVNFVINLEKPAEHQQAQSTQTAEGPSTYTPLKHHLKAVCTLGTGSFG
jgi:hypothetical protein